MKIEEIKIKALKLENGHVIIGTDKNSSFGSSGNIHFVKTGNGIMQYTDNEMLKVYNLDFVNMKYKSVSNDW